MPWWGWLIVGGALLVGAAGGVAGVLYYLADGFRKRL